MAIGDYIAGNLEQAKLLVAVVNESIDKLREYHVALISAAVTGKIDVREEAG